MNKQDILAHIQTFVKNHKGEQAYLLYMAHKNQISEEEYFKAVETAYSK